MTTHEIRLGGWGVDTTRTDAALARRGPGAPTLPPTAEALRLALESPAGTPLLGWSLGAHLLLRALAAGDPRLAGRRVTLVCPFVAFPSEAGAGGRVPLTAVKYLRKWLRRDPSAALTDFHHRAGLPAAPLAAPPYPIEALDAGFTWLESLETPAFPTSPGAAVAVWLGERDPLLDATRLKALLPGASVLAGAGHDIRDFVGVL